MTEDEMLEAKEYNIRLNGWQLYLIISSLDYRRNNDIDTFKRSINDIKELKKELTTRMNQVNKSYRDYHNALVGDTMDDD